MTFVLRITRNSLRAEVGRVRSTSALFCASLSRGLRRTHPESSHSHAVHTFGAMPASYCRGAPRCHSWSSPPATDYYS